MLFSSVFLRPRPSGPFCLLCPHLFLLRPFSVSFPPRLRFFSISFSVLPSSLPPFLPSSLPPAASPSPVRLLCPFLPLLRSTPSYFRSRLRRPLRPFFVLLYLLPPTSSPPPIPRSIPSCLSFVLLPVLLCSFSVFPSSLPPTSSPFPVRLFCPFLPLLRPSSGSSLFFLCPPFRPRPRHLPFACSVPSCLSSVPPPVLLRSFSLPPPSSSARARPCRPAPIPVSAPVLTTSRSARSTRSVPSCLSSVPPSVLLRSFSLPPPSSSARTRPPLPVPPPPYRPLLPFSAAGFAPSYSPRQNANSLGLFVSLTFVEDTPARQTASELAFALAYSYLCLREKPKALPDAPSYDR